MFRDVMGQLAFTISDKKLVPPTTQAVCLCVLIDTIQGTVSIPVEKFYNLRAMIDVWVNKKHCTRKGTSILAWSFTVHR